MGEIDMSDDNPLKETTDARLERELRNNYHMLFQIEQGLQGIINAVEANNANIKILEEAVSSFTTIPARPISSRYNHGENKLWINSRFFILCGHMISFIV